jgi:hypothetical protein
MLLHRKQLLINAIVKSSRYILLVVVAPFFYQNICIAQNNVKRSADQDQSKFEIGIAGGLSLNKFSGQPQTGFNTGYTAGLLLTYNFYKEFSLQLEANSLQQGGQLISIKDDTRIGLPESFTTKNIKNSSIHLNSIEVPLLIKYNFKLQQSWKPALYIGGSYVYNYNATDHYQKTGNLLPGEYIIATVEDTQNVSSQYNSNRFNFIVGGNVQLPLFNSLKLLIDFRYLTGLSPARENYSYMEKIGFGSDIKSNSFVSKVGLVMPLK